MSAVGITLQRVGMALHGVGIQLRPVGSTMLLVGEWLHRAAITLRQVGIAMQESAAVSRLNGFATEVRTSSPQPCREGRWTKLLRTPEAGSRAGIRQRRKENKWPEKQSAAFR